MPNFNLEDYDPVENRIDAFYKDYENGRILTDMVHNDGSRVVFKASIYVGDLIVSTGYAEETKGDGFVNKTSHVENCETSAIGRGLANYNYSGDKRPSREEMSKVTRNQPSTEQKPTPTASSNQLDCTCGTKGKFHAASCPAFKKVQQ